MVVKCKSFSWVRSYTTPDDTSCYTNTSISCTYYNNFRDNTFSSTSEENGISYNQYIEATYIGAGIVNTNLQNLKFDLNFKYSSNVSIKGEDTHHQRNDTVSGSVGTYTANGIYFEDDTDGATLFEYSASVSYDILKNLSVFLTYTYTDLSIAKGTTTAYYLDTPYYSPAGSYDDAGASHESTMSSFGVKYDF